MTDRIDPFADARKRIDYALDTLLGTGTIDEERTKGQSVTATVIDQTPTPCAVCGDTAWYVPDGITPPPSCWTCRTSEVYLSGPTTWLPDQAFEAAAQRLAPLVHAVVSPTQIGQHDGWTWADYIGKALALQADPDIDTTYMMPDWEQSLGACIEHAFARALNHRILYAPGAERTSS